MVYRLLPLAEVAARTCLSKSAVYVKIGLGEFPRSVPLGKRSRAWLEHEIDAWIEERVQARDQKRARRKSCAAAG